MRKVLAAVDGSPLAYTVIRRAYELTRSLGAELTILSVSSSNPMRKVSTSDEEKKLREFHKELITQLFAPNTVKVDTDHGQEMLYKCGPSGEVKILSRIESGDPVERICRDADEIGADLVVIGNRGLGNIGTLVLGSVSEKVVRKSSRSVLVVKDMIAESPSWDKLGFPRKSGHQGA
jgi:nucleotide-binding universal stress UspA family protein